MYPSSGLHCDFRLLSMGVKVAALLTGVVPAASSGGSSPPGAIELADAPVFDRVIFDGVGGQSAQLNTIIVTAEVAEGHPAEIGQGRLLTLLL